LFPFGDGAVDDIRLRSKMIPSSLIFFPSPARQHRLAVEMIQNRRVVVLLLHQA
jgi:hypothetical protein